MGIQGEVFVPGHPNFPEVIALALILAVVGVTLPLLVNGFRLRKSTSRAGGVVGAVLLLLGTGACDHSLRCNRVRLAGTADGGDGRQWGSRARDGTASFKSLQTGGNTVTVRAQSPGRLRRLSELWGGTRLQALGLKKPGF